MLLTPGKNGRLANKSSSEKKVVAAVTLCASKPASQGERVEWTAWLQGEVAFAEKEQAAAVGQICFRQILTFGSLTWEMVVLLYLLMWSTVVAGGRRSQRKSHILTSIHQSEYLHRWAAQEGARPVKLPDKEFSNCTCDIVID